MTRFSWREPAQCGKGIPCGAHNLRRLPLGGKLSPKVTDEGAIDLPNGAGEEARRGDSRHPLFYKERLGIKSPPHPPQCAHWGTYGLWWLRLDLTEQSPGLFDPQGEGFGVGAFF